MLHKILATFNLKHRLLMGVIFVSILTFTNNAVARPCAGQVSKDRDTAQAQFQASCGQEWNDQFRHQCTWVDSPTSGWICHEYAPNGLVVIAPDEPPRPYPRGAHVENDYINVVWRRDAGVLGVNIYRNDEWIASVNYPGTVYNDYTGLDGDSYYLIAYDHDSNFSERSAAFSAHPARVNPP